MAGMTCVTPSGSTACPRSHRTAGSISASLVAGPGSLGWHDCKVMKARH